MKYSFNPVVKNSFTSALPRRQRSCRLHLHMLQKKPGRTGRMTTAPHDNAFRVRSAHVAASRRRWPISRLSCSPWHPSRPGVSQHSGKVSMSLALMPRPSVGPWAHWLCPSMPQHMQGSAATASRYALSRTGFDLGRAVMLSTHEIRHQTHI